VFHKLRSILRKHNDRFACRGSGTPPPPLDWVQRLVTCVLLAFACFTAGAQQFSPDISSGFRQQDWLSEQSSLSYIVKHSDIIFSGQVLRIERDTGQNFVTVEFKVAAGIRGAAPGFFTAKFVEDSPGSFPLRPDERLVAFLRGRNAYGLTSVSAKNCGIFDRSGADRIDIRRLQLCPGAAGVPSALSPEPPVRQPDVRVLPRRKGYTESSTLNEEGLAPSRLLKASARDLTSMDTGQFLSMISDMARSPMSEPYANYRRDPAGLR
jgi:hypothetical protein